MHKQVSREDGMEVHIFYCDYDGCQRRAFAVMHKDSDDFCNLTGWTGVGPQHATHVSELDHYCRKHPYTRSNR